MRPSFVFYRVLSLCSILMIFLIMFPVSVMGQTDCAPKCTCSGSVKCWTGASVPNTCGPVNVTLATTCGSLYYSIVDGCQSQTAQKNHVEFWKVTCTNTLVCK